jgi:AraC-like DNA-binding protein
VQLAIAVSKLAEGHSVSSVAHSLGYRPSSFSDMFRRELGTSPSEFSRDDTLADPEQDTAA